MWSYGPNSNASLPSGLTPPVTTLSLSSNTYTSTLQFSVLSQSHTGMYTCRLGAGRLVNSAMVTVNGKKNIDNVVSGAHKKNSLLVVKFNMIRCIIIVYVLAPPISVMITANLNATLILGQTGYTLTCEVSGADRLVPTLTYQWTRNNETVTEGASMTLTLSPLRLSHAGNYACTVNSALLNENVSSSGVRTVIIQSESQNVM